MACAAHSWLVGVMLLPSCGSPAPVGLAGVTPIGSVEPAPERPPGGGSLCACTSAFEASAERTEAKQDQRLEDLHDPPRYPHDRLVRRCYVKLGDQRAACLAPNHPHLLLALDVRGPAPFCAVGPTDAAEWGRAACCYRVGYHADKGASAGSGVPH